MAVIYIPTVIVGAAILVFILFFLRGVLVPHRLEQIQNLIARKRTGQAIRALKILIGKDERNIDARYLLGKAFLAERKAELAFMEYKRINTLGKFGSYCREAVFRKEMAELYALFDQSTEAMKEYVLLAKLEPRVADHYYRIGLLFEKNDASKNSLGYYLKAVKLDPKHASAHLRIGKIYAEAMKTSEAKAEISEALKYDPDNHEAHFSLGRLYKGSQDYQNAILCFDKAQKSPEYLVKSLMEKGICYLDSRNYPRAISNLTRAVRINEEKDDRQSLYARYFLASAYEKSRSLEKAIGEWEKIYAVKPGFQDVGEKLSQYQELRTDDSIKDYLTVGREQFFRICQSVVRAMDLEVRETSDINGGCQVIGAEAESKWRNVRKMPRLIWFLRVTEPVGESSVRQLSETMKKLRIPRGIIFSTSRFVAQAQEYAEPRPVELLGRDKLKTFLAKAD